MKKRSARGTKKNTNRVWSLRDFLLEKYSKELSGWDGHEFRVEARERENRPKLILASFYNCRSGQHPCSEEPWTEAILHHEVLIRIDDEEMRIGDGSLRSLFELGKFGDEEDNS